MDDSNRKGKQPMEASDDQTPPPSSRYHPSSRSRQQPPSSSTASSSSSHPQMIIQEIESQRLNLTSPQTTTTMTQESPSSPSSPSRILLSSIPRASSRPFFNTPSSGSQRPPPHPQAESRQLSIAKTSTSSSSSVFSLDQNLAAKLRLMKSAERADFRLSNHLGNRTTRKKRRREAPDQSEAGRTRVTRIRIGSSPLGPDLTPYQKVQKCIIQLKDYINSIAGSDTSAEAPQPLTDPSAAHATSSSSSRPLIASATTDHDHIHAASSLSSSKADVGLIAPSPRQPHVDSETARATSSSSRPMAPPPPPPMTTYTDAASSSKAVCYSSSAATDVEWTVEDVIGLLEEFLTRIPTTIGAQEMENGLWEIQTRLSVDHRHTWYALMCKSYEHMWECLIDYFDCDALENSLLKDVIEKDPSGFGASGAGPSSF